MDSDDKGGPASEPSVELQRRASGAAQRAADLATAGFPSFDALQARTGKYFARVEKKLDAVPAERQQPPPPTIAAPAAFQYALLGESDEVAELREMFENLLAASMDRETASNAHPAFVSMISQLTPDEARILKSIDQEEYAFVEVLQHGDERVIDSWTWLGKGTRIDETRFSEYFENLQRLGIISVSSGNTRDIDGHNAIVRAIEAKYPSRHTFTKGSSIRVTPLGVRFLDTCVRGRPLAGAVGAT